MANYLNVDFYFWKVIESQANIFCIGTSYYIFSNKVSRLLLVTVLLANITKGFLFYIMLQENGGDRQENNSNNYLFKFKLHELYN